MGISNTSVKWRLALFLQFLGFILCIVAVSSTYMAAAEVIPNRWHHIGIWDICFDTLTFSCQEATEFVMEKGEDPEWVYASRGLLVTSLIFGGLSMLVAVYMAYMASGIHMANLVTAIMSLFGVLLGLIGSIVFTMNSVDILQDYLEMEAYPAWGFMLFSIGMFFYLCAALLSFLEMCRGN